MYSFVIPIFNEQESVPMMYSRLCDLLERLDGPAEVFFVNDGSTDHSGKLLSNMVNMDPRFRLLELSRNFGHQIAISAGLDHADGDAVIIMDGDLQDPPEAVLEMIAAWRKGAEVVYGVRLQRQGESALKKLTASVFYRILGSLSDVKLPLDAGDFRLVDRKAVLAFRSLKERNRYVRGMFSWVGFRQESISYIRHARVAGSTKFSWRKMLRFAGDGIIGFSGVPVRVISYLGLTFTGLGVLLGVGSFFQATDSSRWWTDTMFLPGLFVFVAGVQLCSLGIMGHYLT